MRLYEDNVASRISDDRFAMMSRAYEDEQCKLKAEAELLRQEIEAQEQQNQNLELFIQKVRKYAELTELTSYAAHIVEADYLGIASGNNVTDKFARTGLTATKAETVDAPVINEFPLCLECEFIEYQADETGIGVIGKVLSVTADESVMRDGKVDMTLVNAIAFDPYTHGYYRVSERVGDAFKDGMKLK